MESQQSSKTEKKSNHNEQTQANRIFKNKWPIEQMEWNKWSLRFYFVENATEKLKIEKK